MKNFFSVGLAVFILSISSAHAALPSQKDLKDTLTKELIKPLRKTSASKLSKYNVNMRIALKGGAPFSVNTVAKAGKKSSVTEISSDGNIETFVQMTPRKSTRDQKSGLVIDLTVIRKIRGEIRASEKMQIFAFENEESEVRLNARGRGQQDLAVAVLANPI